jgi:hypothetical protein
LKELSLNLYENKWLELYLHPHPALSGNGATTLLGESPMATGRQDASATNQKSKEQSLNVYENKG